MIHFENIGHHYSLSPVLKGINLTIEAGDVVAVMGPNGSGKSTLLRIAAGLQTPLEGRVSVGGHYRRATPESELAARQLTYYLAAQPPLPLYTTVADFLFQTGLVYGVAHERISRHATDLLRAFDLENHVNTDLHELSTGQRSKVGLMAALVCDAPVLLLDEPLGGGLDPGGLLAAKAILQQLRHLRTKTIIMATPVPEHVDETASKVLILRNGKIAAYGSPEQLCQQSDPPAPNLTVAYTQLVDPERFDRIRQYTENQLHPPTS